MSSCCHSCYQPRLTISLFLSSVVLLIFLFFQQFFDITINSSSSFFAFYIFGLIAGFSTCSPITGSLFLSFYKEKKSALIFLISRTITFLIFGYFLGSIGGFSQIFLKNIGITNLIVSLITLILALNFLRIFTLKSTIISKVTRLSAGPVIAGIITFFLPCGFTLTAQSIALVSASPLTSSLIMLSFCLGTISPLILMLISPNKITQNQKFSAYFNQIFGILLLIFSLYSINSSFTLLNLPSFTFAKDNTTKASENIIKMTASPFGYSPNYFKIKAGQKIRWEITDAGSSGCTNAIIAKSLFPETINLVSNTTSIKEFTAPTLPGKYAFSCWMGMVSGTIEVIN
ncbi:MAG TPA: sulfite exporter TauE/SafE family protein [Candidatus Methanoperedens sp.]|nr:sulfite exporter TauE/SafE family protein [Candidatus Methanoperedens sp.]